MVHNRDPVTALSAAPPFPRQQHAINALSGNDILNVTMKSILNLLPAKRVICALSLAMMWSTLTARAQMPEMQLAIAGHKLTAEVAATNPERMQGLMHRRMMPEDRKSTRLNSSH